MLNTNVLVLNRLFEAVQIVSARRAFALFYKGHVDAVLDDYTTYSWNDWKDVPPGAADDYVATPQLRVRVPRVILLHSYGGVPRHEVKFCRKNVYLRDRSRCQYCSKRFRTEDLNLDHVLPVSRGGKSTWDNVVCSCIPCNKRKGNHLPEEVGMRLFRKPVRPRWHPLYRARCLHEEWKNFLDEAYWNVEMMEDSPSGTGASG